jgi:hypothetical protein
MADSKKKTKATISAEIDLEDTKWLGEYLDLIIESLKEGSSQKMEDPFEWYALHVRSQFYSNLKDLHPRFFKGYKVLIEELSKKHN